MHARRITIVLLVLGLLLQATPAQAAGEGSRRPPRDDGGKEFRHMPIGTTQRRGSQTEPDRDRTYTRDTGRSRGGNQNGGGGPTGGEDFGRPPGGGLFTPMSAIVARYAIGTADTFDSTVKTRVNFATKQIDSHNMVTTGASWLATMAASGLVTVTASLLFDTSTAWAAGEALRMALELDGAEYVGLDIKNNLVSGGTAIYARAYGATSLSLATGQTLAINCTQSSGATLALVPSALWNWIILTVVKG